MNFKQEIKAGKLVQQIKILIAKFDHQDPPNSHKSASDLHVL